MVQPKDFTVLDARLHFEHPLLQLNSVVGYLVDQAAVYSLVLYILLEFYEVVQPSNANLVQSLYKNNLDFAVQLSDPLLDIRKVFEAKIIYYFLNCF